MSDLIEKVKYDRDENGKKTVNLDDITPGARLRYEREQRNLSIQNVADHLYLESRVIKCLENDEYDGLPQGIFVRGYIRNYARYLEIPADPLVKGYREMVGEVDEVSQPTIQQTKQVKRTKQATSKDLWFKFLTFTIVITSLSLMALWRLNPTDSQTGNTEETPAELIDGDESIQTLPITLEDEDGLLPSEEDSEETVNTTTPVPITNSPTQPIETESVLPPEPVTENDDGGTLKLFFDGDAWVGITDSTEKELKSGTVAKGEELVLNGKAPFKIKSARLGQIRAEYKGKTFALKNHSNREGNWVTIGETTME